MAKEKRIFVYAKTGISAGADAPVPDRKATTYDTFTECKKWSATWRAMGFTVVIWRKQVKPHESSWSRYRTLKGENI